MKEHKLHHVAEASDREIEMYDLVEHVMQKRGELRISKAEMEQELTDLKDFHYLKDHGKFHYVTFIVGTGAVFTSYYEYSHQGGPTPVTFLFLIAGMVLYGISWFLIHPQFKHENEVRKYYEKHWREFEQPNDNDE